MSGRRLLLLGGRGGGVPFGGPLRLDANYFVNDSGLVYPLGMTGFLLRKRFLTGLASEAGAYLDLVADTARAAGEGVVPLLREFCEVDWDGIPENQGGKGGVEPGFLMRDFPDYDSVSHQMYEAAEQRGIYVQTVGLTGRAMSVQEAVDLCARVDALAAQHPNATFQLANEPGRNNIPVDDIIARFSPTCRPADTGRLDPSPHPGWEYVGDHPGRSDQSCRYFKGGWEVQSGEGPNNKFTPGWPGGFFQDEPGRIEDPVCWPALDDLSSFYAGNRFFCAGGLIHGGQWAQGCHVDMLTADLRLRLAACVRGVRAVPRQRYYEYQHPNDQGSLRRYRRRNGAGQWYEISVRPFGFSAV